MVIFVNDRDHIVNNSYSVQSSKFVVENIVVFVIEYNY